ncbi:MULTISPECIES: sulfite exporter TauE/SafE family protein [Alteromonas]|uniref:sulfite exporter TauE/SafE family protein n=1 Tax=Alteromonas TaxID=226 RepID=UPI0009041A63|nr:MULTISPECIES: sulfite exporter TauE/SafE family protein [Alteromonas]APE07267.1 hypothetical protein BM528_16995 [Alteromonas sp. RW2A1]
MNIFYELITAGGALSTLSATLLIVASFFTSLITASLGIGGGVLLLAILASTLPLTALIPVHGLVQLGSNGNRALMTRTHVDKQIVMYFSFGALLGGILASFIVVQLPLVFIQFAVSGFILFMVWGKKPKAHELSPIGRSIAGFITTILSMFVGATGPLVAAFVHRSVADKMRITATLATCMTIQHALKAFVFLFVGFSFGQWGGVIVAMIASGALGTFVGLRVLKRVPNETFNWLFKAVITLLAIRLLWQAIQNAGLL